MGSISYGIYAPTPRRRGEWVDFTFIITTNGRLYDNVAIKSASLPRSLGNSFLFWVVKSKDLPTGYNASINFFTGKLSLTGPLGYIEASRYSFTISAKAYGFNRRDANLSINIPITIHNVNGSTTGNAKATVLLKA